MEFLNAFSHLDWPHVLHLTWQHITLVGIAVTLAILVGVPLGGRYTLSRWPANSSWDFVAVGRGHDVEWWAGFLRALAAVDPDMAVNIEHEDQELGQLEGLQFAANTLLDARGKALPFPPADPHIEGPK